MKKIFVFSIFINILFANSLKQTEAYTFTKTNLKEKPTKTSQTIKTLKRAEEINIISIEFDGEKNYWYKTKYGYVFGKSVSTDLRYSKVDFLRIRLSPSLKGKIVYYYLKGDKVIVIRDAGKTNNYNWVYTTDGYSSSDYLSQALIKSFRTNNITFYQKKSIKSKINKIQEAKKVKFIVPKAKSIPLGKTIEDLIQEFNNKKIIKAPTIKRKNAEPLEQIEKKDEFIFSKTYLHSVSIGYLKSISSSDINSPLNNNLDNNTMGLNLKFNYKNDYYKNKKLILELESLNNTYKNKYHLLLGVNQIFSIYKFNFSAGLSLGLSKLSWIKDAIENSISSNKDSLSPIIKFNIENTYIISKSFNININLNQSYYSHETLLKKGIDTYTISDKQTRNLNFEILYKF